MASASYDIEFFWDPVCPFCWITSRWIEKVAAQREFSVDWRFISLRLLNKDKDYATEFPPEYEQGHTAGLRMLRVAAAIREAEGRAALGPVVTAYGNSYWDRDPGSGTLAYLSTPEHVAEVLTNAGLSTDYVSALDDTSRDGMLDDEGELALSRTGRDVGTPIITFRPDTPEAMSFFGPVISRVPSDEEAVVLWDAVTTLATFPGFAELKRSMREVPQLNVIGGVSDTPEQEDWQGGHRRGHLPGDEGNGQVVRGGPSSPATAQDVHDAALAMPHVTVGHGSRDNPVYQVGGKSFVYFRTPRPDAVDPDTRERYPDVIIIWVGSQMDKQALVQDTASPFFTTDHFDGHPSVLVRASRLDEVEREEIVELVQEAWLSRASRRRASTWLGEHGLPPLE